MLEWLMGALRCFALENDFLNPGLVDVCRRYLEPILIQEEHVGRLAFVN
jgi:hypothetical protein